MAPGFVQAAARNPQQTSIASPQPYPVCSQVAPLWQGAGWPLGATDCPGVKTLPKTNGPATPLSAKMEAGSFAKPTATSSNGTHSSIRVDKSLVSTPRRLRPICLRMVLALPDFCMCSFVVWSPASRLCIWRVTDLGSPSGLPAFTLELLDDDGVVFATGILGHTRAPTELSPNSRADRVHRHRSND
jgi:hypothetical protein